MYKKCPQEVVDHIQYWLFEIVFCPGHLYINRYPGIETCGWPKTSPGRPTLLSLSKGILSKYEQRLWTENTFILASVGDLLDGQDGTWEEIDKLHIAVTIRDIGTGWAESIPPPGTYPEYDSRTFSENDDGSGLSSLVVLSGVLEGHDMVPKSHACDKDSMPLAQGARLCYQCKDKELAGRWLTKLRVALHLGLKLEQLTLDFTECYSSRGYWLGNILADELGSIREDLPDELEVLAPDPQKRKELLALICGPIEGS